ncbi:hypothetical protein [uncultured Alsobacter sp.]|uniref:hypothetical protein n=1 Tax=uncultured Alsobacter sp. TaxID=1748258 RepID=UPI0025EC4015|nr:hypothetical protein [uncultured Alsobacter sp.]
MKTIQVLILAAAVALPGAALAQAAKPAGKAGASYTVKVSNGRTVAVSSLSFVPQGEATGPNLLKKPLEPGKSISLVVKAKKGQCLFDVAGGYDDEAEITGSGLNLCKDKTLALVD